MPTDQVEQVTGLLRYQRRRPAGEVEAMKLTQRNGAEVAEWCGGESFDVGMAPGLTHHVNVPAPKRAGVGPVARAKPGDYIRRSEAGHFAVMSGRRFDAFYELAPNPTGGQS